jgi:hypothetical protein
MSQANRQPISRVIQEFAASGKQEHFYEIARGVSPDTGIGPFAETLNKLINLSNPEHPQDKTLSKVSDSEYAERSTTLFQSDVEQIRSDSDFTGSSQQLDYIRDILNSRC